MKTAQLRTEIPFVNGTATINAEEYETCVSNDNEANLRAHRETEEKRILVIEDNPDIVFTLRVGLESDPTMQVFGFDNPVTALVEFKPNFYDLLLIDVNMPLL